MESFRPDFQRASIENIMVEGEVFYIEDFMFDCNDNDGDGDGDDDDSNYCKQVPNSTVVRGKDDATLQQQVTGKKSTLSAPRVHEKKNGTSSNVGPPSTRSLGRDISGKIDYFEDDNLPIGAINQGKILRRRGTLERAKAFFGSLSNVVYNTGEDVGKMKKCHDKDDENGEEEKKVSCLKSRRNKGKGKLSASTTNNKHEAALHSSMKLFDNLAAKRGIGSGEMIASTIRGNIVSVSGIDEGAQEPKTKNSSSNTNLIKPRRRNRKRGDFKNRDRHLSASVTTNEHEAALKSSMTLFDKMAAKRDMGMGEKRGSVTTNASIDLSSPFSASDQSLDVTGSTAVVNVFIPSLGMTKSRRGSNDEEIGTNYEKQSNDEKAVTGQGEKSQYLNKISDILYIG